MASMDSMGSMGSMDNSIVIIDTMRIRNYQVDNYNRKKLVYFNLQCIHRYAIVSDITYNQFYDACKIHKV